VSIDDLARSAAAELRESTSARIDTKAMLAAIAPASRRRSRLYVASAMGALVAVALCGWLLINPVARPAPAVQPHPTPSPSQSVLHRTYANGPIVVAPSTASDAVSSTVIAVDPVTGAALSSELTKGVVSGASVSWSPDGQQFAYSAGGGVWLRTVATGAQHMLTACFGACSVAWSPDDITVAVAQPYSVDFVDVRDGHTAWTLAEVQARGLTWAPDGKRLAFVAHTDTDHPSLQVVDADGTHLRTLVTAAALGLLEEPAWAPDGSRIAYLLGIPKTAVVGTPTVVDKWLSVMTVDPSDGASTRVREAGSCFCIGYAPGLAWSPDDQLLAVIMLPLTGPTAGKSGLYVMAPDGTGFRLLHADVNGPLLAWQPIQTFP
jgi:Tol biopolymer transport system component